MSKTSPRDVPDRDDFYMGMAFWYASKSKDPHTQCGACIVAANNSPLGFGYNGPPAEICDEEVDWSRPHKYHLIRHSEENAIDHSDKGKTVGATIYITDKPCSRCTLAIVKARIAEIVYFEHQGRDSESMTKDHEDQRKAEEIIRLSGITWRAFCGDLDWMRDRIKFMQQLGIFE